MKLTGRLQLEPTDSTWYDTCLNTARGSHCERFWHYWKRSGREWMFCRHHLVYVCSTPQIDVCVCFPSFVCHSLPLLKYGKCKRRFDSNSEANGLLIDGFQLIWNSCDMHHSLLFLVRSSWRVLVMWTLQEELKKEKKKRKELHHWLMGRFLVFKHVKWVSVAISDTGISEFWSLGDRSFICAICPISDQIMGNLPMFCLDCLRKCGVWVEKIRITAVYFVLSADRSNGVSLTHRSMAAIVQYWFK